MGSVPNCRKEIPVHDAIRWFKCKLKPPKKQMGIFITPLNQMVDTLKIAIFCDTPHFTKSGDFSLVK